MLVLLDGVIGIDCCGDQIGLDYWLDRFLESGDIKLKVEHITSGTVEEKSLSLNKARLVNDLN